MGVVTTCPVFSVPIREAETIGVQRRPVTETATYAVDNVALQETGVILPVVRLGNSATTKEIAPILRRAVPVNALS